jgi:hypothetical protein
MNKRELIQALEAFTDDIPIYRLSLNADKIREDLQVFYNLENGEGRIIIGHRTPQISSKCVKLI